MSRNSGVTTELVRRACFELMAQSERPTRPAVQALLEKPEYLGRKGSNELVQSLINEFWVSMGKTFNTPARQVDGVPAAFVSVVDKALLELVDIARRMASASLADSEKALDVRAKEVEAKHQAAMDAVNVADQLRVRAEGELAASSERITELKGALAIAERKLSDESAKLAAAVSTIGDKDAELRRAAESLDRARDALERAKTEHRNEANRLLQQMDDERQAARKHAERQAEQLDHLRSEFTTAREGMVLARAEATALRAAKEALEARLSQANVTTDSALARMRTAEDEVTVLRVRFETAEQLRKEASDRCTAQSEEIGQMRKTIERLEAARAEKPASRKTKPGGEP